MRTLAALVALAVAAPSLAAPTITIEKKGMYPNFIWLDGAPKGKVKNKKGMVLTVTPGMHELWVAYEDGATVTHCHGTVDVPEAGTFVGLKMMGCDGLTLGAIGEKTMFRGAKVQFSQNGEVDAWVSVDGGRSLAMGGSQVDLNLAPGQHNIVLYNDVMGETVFDQGSFTLGQGQTLPITCTPGGCMGWEVPPVVLVVVPSSPLISIDINQGGSATQVNVGGMGISTSVDVTGMDMGDVDMSTSVTTTGTPTSTTTSGHGGNADLTCCVNGAFYECPSADAVYTCTGAFMQCVMGCDMMDMECPSACEDKHPIDPSECSRTSGRDGECDS